MRDAPLLPPAPRWYAVETLPRQEGLAVEQMARQAYAGFCPRLRRIVNHARRRRESLEPLFPGYVFVRLDPDRHGWRAINGTRGVKRLVGSGGERPQALAPGVVERLLARCQNGVMIDPIGDAAPGDPVRIIAGPLADRLARIERLDGCGRISVLLEMLGETRQVTVPRDCLAPARAVES